MTDPASLAPFADALDRATAGTADGVGVSLAAAGLLGIDLDDCRDLGGRPRPSAASRPRSAAPTPSCWKWRSAPGTGRNSAACGTGTRAPTRPGRKLGYKLRSFARRVFDGLFLDRAGDTSDGVRWAVFPASEFARRRPASPPSPRGAGGDGGDGSAARGDRLFDPDGGAPPH